MAKQAQNIWIYVIIALIVGFVIGYAVAGGFAAGGKAIAKTGPGGTLQAGGDSCGGCLWRPNKLEGEYSCYKVPGDPSKGLTCCDCETGARPIETT